ncbi:hypothetical protein [Deinococcus rubellus]|uniref:hypothetical protein n=1 Tax=Deinococcus rubellus TaxID=1889240 RepID=UPI0031EB55DF
MEEGLPDVYAEAAQIPTTMMTTSSEVKTLSLHIGRLDAGGTPHGDPPDLAGLDLAEAHFLASSDERLDVAVWHAHPDDSKNRALRKNLVPWF